MENTNFVGNITTIINWIVLIILPYVSAYGITQDVLFALISSIVGIIFAVINSTYLNDFSFLGNSTPNNQSSINSENSE